MKGDGTKKGFLLTASPSAHARCVKLAQKKVKHYDVQIQGHSPTLSYSSKSGQHSLVTICHFVEERHMIKCVYARKVCVCVCNWKIHTCTGGIFCCRSWDWGGVAKTWKEKSYHWLQYWLHNKVKCATYVLYCIRRAHGGRRPTPQMPCTTGHQLHPNTTIYGSSLLSTRSGLHNIMQQL